MREAEKYLKVIEWSDEDQCFIGSCPELFRGGCHGQDARVVFDELCLLIEETVEVYLREGKDLPSPLTAKALLKAMQKVA